MSSQQLPVSISVTYSLGGKAQGANETTTFEWNDSNVASAHMGLALGQEPVQPQAGDFSYSGMHDHGQLPALQQGGPMALLISCVEQAKQKNDEFLTAQIQQASTSEHADKKIKVDELT